MARTNRWESRCSEKLARANYKAADLRVFDTNDLTFEAMFRGDVEAIIMDDVLITSRTDTAAWKLVGELLSREGYGIMLPPGESDLKSAVDGILATLRADGRLSALMQKHRIREGTQPAGLGCP